MKDEKNATKKDGLAIAKRISDNKYNFITEDGKLLSDEWFENAHSFHDGLAKVQRSYKQYNFINKQGKFLSNEWFNYLDDFFIDGFARVQRTNGELAKIDKTGKLIKLQ